MNFSLFHILSEKGRYDRPGHGSINRFEHLGPFSESGHLGLPKVALSQFPSINDYSSRVTMLFAWFKTRRDRILEDARELMLHTSICQESAEFAHLVDQFERSNTELTGILENIRIDARVAALQGTMISRGNGGRRFEVDDLTSWFLWYANEVGIELARTHLDQWLDATEVDVLNTLWVNGIEIDETIQLEDGYQITPVQQMPDSRDKEIAMQFTRSKFAIVEPLPTVAITRICRIQKVCNLDPSGLPIELNSDHQETIQNLQDIASVVNVLPGVSCSPAMYTSYLVPKVPFGPFGGSGGGIPVHDVIGFQKKRISSEQAADLQIAIDHFSRLKPQDKERFRLILSRIAQGKRRFHLADKFLDFGIALEMLLLSDRTEMDQISQIFRLRGSWLISHSGAERLANDDTLKVLYTLRSKVAHSGSIGDVTKPKTQQALAQYPAIEAIVEKICSKLLEHPHVNWQSLILGGDLQTSPSGEESSDDQSSTVSNL